MERAMSLSTLSLQSFIPCSFKLEIE